MPARRILYFDVDQLNTPRAARDQTGVVVWRWEGDAFGATPPNQNPSGKGIVTVNFRFPGQYFDQESGLSYNANRDYDPSIGRYVESDPIGLDGGVNTFAYSDANPISKTGFLGLATYMCTRNLSNVPFRVGPLFHQYVCVPDGKGGQTCGGLGPSGKMFDSPGVIEYEKTSSSSSSCEKAANDNTCIEQCIKDDFKKTSPNYSVDLSKGQNCQIWVTSTVSSCQLQCVGKK